MRAWAAVARHRFQEPERQWLEGLNPENVPYYRWLHMASWFLLPRVAVELGVCKAFGSAHIASGRMLMTVGVDVNPWRPEFDETLKLIRERELNYRFIEGTSTAPETVVKVAGVVRQFGPIGLLFIDTIHTYRQALEEFRAYQSLLAYGSLVVMDDILDPPDEVYRAFREIPGTHVEMPDLHISGRGSVGFGAVIYQA